MMFCNSLGSGPTKSAPLTGRIATICWRPSSASPRGQELGDRAGSQFGLGLHRFGQPKPLHETGDVERRSAHRYSSRTTPASSGALESVDGRDARLRRAGAHRNSDRRAGDVGHAAGGDPARTAPGHRCPPAATGRCRIPRRPRSPFLTPRSGRFRPSTLTAAAALEQRDRFGHERPHRAATEDLDCVMNLRVPTSAGHPGGNPFAVLMRVQKGRQRGGPSISLRAAAVTPPPAAPRARRRLPP